MQKENLVLSNTSCGCTYIANKEEWSVSIDACLYQLLCAPHQQYTEIDTFNSHQLYNEVLNRNSVFKKCQAEHLVHVTNFVNLAQP